MLILALMLTYLAGILFGDDTALGQAVWWGHTIALVVFLVRRAATAGDIRDGRGPNPWLRDAAPELVTSVAAEVAAWSVLVEQACGRLRIPCFDVGEDFERSMAAAAEVLRR